MRKKIFDIIEPASEGNLLSKIYDSFMIFTIIISLLPLAFREENIIFDIIEIYSVTVFVLDYIMRFLTADLKLKRGVASFFILPFTPMAIVDLLSILPSVALFNQALKLLRIFRLLRAIKVLRALKFLRYSKSFVAITNVFRKQKKILLAVAGMAFAYVLISALIIYNVEPQSFETLFDAIYWATISLTTVGYGDIYPVTDFGRVVTMFSSVFGIAIIALPSGVITAGYLAEMNDESDDKNA